MRITSGIFTSLIIAIPFIISGMAVYKNADKDRIITLMLLAILFIYILNLFKYAVFPIYIGGSIKDSLQNDRSLNVFEHLNLIPFLKNFYLKDFLLNIIMTIPLGFLVSCFKKNVKSGIICLCVLTGFLLEFIQLILAILQGFTLRDININDSIANGLGFYAGYSMLILFLSILRKIPVYSNRGILKALQSYFEEFID